MKIEIKGKEYGLHWGLGAIELASDVTEKTKDELFYNSLLVNSEMKVTAVSHEVMFGALLNWCEENDQKYDGTYINFVNAYNDLGKERHLEIVEIYKKSNYVSATVEEIFDEILAKIPPVETVEDNGIKKKKATTSKSSKTASSGV